MVIKAITSVPLRAQPRIKRITNFSRKFIGLMKEPMTRVAILFLIFFRELIFFLFGIIFFVFTRLFLKFGILLSFFIQNLYFENLFFLAKFLFDTRGILQFNFAQKIDESM